MYKSQFKKKKTLMTGFVVQDHIYHYIAAFAALNHIVFSQPCVVRIHKAASQ